MTEYDMLNLFRSIVTCRPIALGLAAVVSLMAPSVLCAQSTTTDTVEILRHVPLGNQSPMEARRQAIDEARAEAVRQVVGTQVQAERRSATIDHGEEVVDRFSEVIRTGASGRVVDSEVLEDTLTERNGAYFFELRLRAAVVAEQGRTDPAFQVSLALNEDDQVYVDRGSLRESDEIVATMETTQDAHLTLFDVAPDTVAVVWPNAITSDTFAPANTPVEFPPPELRTSGGLRFRVQVPDDRGVETRRLVVVATKEKIPFRSVPDYRVQKGELTTSQASLQAFNRWLVNIPLDQRAMVSATYDVKAASDR